MDYRLHNYHWFVTILGLSLVCHHPRLSLVGNHLLDNNNLTIY